MNWSCKLTLWQRERDGGGGQPPVKSEVRAQSNTVGRLVFFGGGDAREYPGGLLRLDPAFAYAEPPSSWPLSRMEGLLLPSIFPSIGVFSNELALRIRWPKYWSFSFNISSFNEYSGLISFRIDWCDLFTVQGTLKTPLTPQFKSINSLALSFFYSPTLTSIHDYWKNHSLD